MHKNIKYSVYLTKDESDLLHEIVTTFTIEGKKPSYSEIFSQALLLLHATMLAKQEINFNNIRVIESNPSDEEN